ncbi:hypothetical protein LX32DRAFT_54025 [Colletotrichum zoysiae]|uniref:Uncharacterized protein n=1 Tax=Colletotrichum zoysiae TaxID=1216348 RepID=A0AAD9LX08_9PEZI|nr:hypothetical protein LX32DRAFT_54025 [Colletotrichum zoysiae]
MRSDHEIMTDPLLALTNKINRRKAIGPGSFHSTVHEVIVMLSPEQPVKHHPPARWVQNPVRTKSMRLYKGNNCTRVSGTLHHINLDSKTGAYLDLHTPRPPIFPSTVNSGGFSIGSILLVHSTRVLHNSGAYGLARRIFQEAKSAKTIMQSWD